MNARKFSLPAAARDVEPIIPAGSDLEIYAWESDSELGGQAPCAAAFAGQSAKPLWRFRFPTAEARQRKIDETVSQRGAHAARKAQRATERRAFQHDFKVGDVLVSSWGYEQTNVDFYEIVSCSGSMVTLRQIAGECSPGDCAQADRVLPRPGAFLAGERGAPFRRRVCGGSHGSYVAIKSYSSASKWNGRPQYQTASGWGH